MFKSNPFAGVMPFRNGTAVPSFGGTPSLASAMARVEAAEQTLSAARAAARAAAKAEGKSTRHLFDGHPYVARASAERWCGEARSEGEKAMVNILSRSVSMESMDEKSPFQHLAKRLKKIRPDDWPAFVAKMRAVMDSAEPRWKQMRAAGYFEAVAAEDYDKAAAIYREVNPELFAQSKGEAILAAGRRARMSADAAGEVPEPTGFAAKVIAAGKKRRNES